MNFFSRHRKMLYGILSVAGLSFMLGFFNRYHLPKIKNWLLVEVEAFSEKNLPVKIWPQSVEFHFFPVGVSFKDIRVQPKIEVAKILAPTTVAEADLRLSFLSFLQGRLELGTVSLTGADLKIFIRADNDKKKPQLHFNRELLARVPVQSLRLNQISLWVRDENSELSFQTPRLDLGVDKRAASVALQVNARSLRIKKTDETPIFEANVDTRFHVTEKEITFNRVKLQKDDSFLISSGWLEWEAAKNKFNRVVSRSRASFRMPDVEVVLREFLPAEKIPTLKGHVAVEIQSDHTFGKKLQGDFKVKTEGLQISHYFIGNATASGKVDEQHARFEAFEIRHPGGRVRLKNFDFGIVEPYAFKAGVAGDKVDVHALLNGIGIKDVAVFTDLSPDVTCEGQITGFFLKCQGKVGAPSILVKSDMRAETPIVLLKNGSLDGSLRVDGKKVSYRTKIQLPHSKGQSEGEISYDKGFKISYETDHLDLADVKEVSGILFSGVTSIKGTTEGNSHSARIDMKVAADGMTLDRFGLGKVTADVRYRNGVLSFNEAKGQHRSTQYSGQLSLNLQKHTMFLEMHSPFIDLENVTDLLASKWKIPFELTGTGSAHFKLRGPMSFAKMDMNVDATLYRGLIAGESYDQFRLVANADDGHFTTKKLSLTKGPGVLKANFDGRFDGDVTGHVEGRGFRIEQSENISRLDMKVTGILSTDVDVSGKLSSPSFKASGQLSGVAISDIPVADTSFTAVSDTQSLSGSADFSDKVVHLEGLYDWASDGRFRLKGTFNDWNFSQMFSAFSDSMRANTYSAKVKGSFNFEGPKNDLDRLSGVLAIETFQMQNGESSLSNSAPMKITVQNGDVRSENFSLRGGDSFLRLESEPAKSGHLNLDLNGKLDLKLLSLLTPFLEDIQGRVNLAVALTGRISKPLISGNTYIDNGFLRFKGLPHPLEQLSSDIIFDQNKIIINSIKSRLAGGTVAASGQILLNSLNNVPVDIRGQFLDTTFQVPAGFTTRGSGNFTLKGNWFPYLVSVDYDIVSGKVDREIKAAASNQKEIQPSMYLPKFVAEKRFSPVNLDLDVLIPNDFPVHMLVTRLDINSRVSGKVKVTGSPDRPLLTGRIQIAHGSKVTFRNNIFEVQNGYVEYKNTPPEDPYLNITADSRVSVTVKDTDTADSRERQYDYDVSLRVLGPATQPDVTASSQPPLSQSELISLLTLGFISQPDNSSTENQSGALTNTSYQLGSAFLNEQLGLNREIGKRLGVEFDFSSGFDTNDNAAVHTFTVKKQWSPKFGTSASRSVGKTNTNNVRAEYKINNNLSVIGNYEGKEQAGSGESTTEQIEPNLFGVDVEYKVDFK